MAEPRPCHPTGTVVLPGPHGAGTAILLVVATLPVLANLLTAGNYGLFRDEFYLSLPKIPSVNLFNKACRLGAKFRSGLDPVEEFGGP